MNWQSKKLYLAALIALLLAIGTLYLVAVQVKKSYDAELKRSNLETELLSIAIEHHLLAELAQIKLIQRLAAEKIDPLLSNSQDHTVSSNKGSELLMPFLQYSKISSAIGVINENNTLLAAASLNNTNLALPTLPTPQSDETITIYTAPNSLFVLQGIKLANGNRYVFFSKIENKKLAQLINEFHQNKDIEIILFDRKKTTPEKMEGIVFYNSKQAIETLIQAEKNLDTLQQQKNSLSKPIGDTSLSLFVRKNNLAHLESWTTTSQTYLFACLLIFGLVLQIIYFFWRSKRLNQTLILKENKLTASETRFRQMIEAMPIGLILARVPDYLIMYINQPAAQILDLPQASALSKRAFDFYLDSSEFKAQVHRLNQSKTSENIECRLIQHNGTTFWASISISLVQVTDAQTLLIGIVDISERKKLEAELKQQATIDHLSSLFNRVHFISSANTEIQRIQRHKKNASLLMLDIDHFKRVNDSYGHDMGDLVIQTIALTCKETLREIDIIGRLGGEEFAALLPETSLDEALKIAERLRGAIESKQIKLTDQQTICITSSIGVTDVDYHDEIIDVALKRADLAMYASKNNGRNQVQSLAAKH